MKSQLAILLVLTFGGGSLLAADDVPVKGAKELFFDPTDGSVVSATQPNALPAPPPAQQGRARKSASSRPSKKTTQSQTLAQTPTSNRQDANVEQVRTPKTPTTTLGLSYWIEFVDHDGQGQQVTDKRIFRSGEKIRLHFRSNADGNIVLLQLGTSGTSSVLFPDAAKGLVDNRLIAAGDRILPKDSAWFRFDNKPGTEIILVLFGRSTKDLDTFPIKTQMDTEATQAMMKITDGIRGKDLILETETEKPSEVGTYAVNLAGKPVVLEIQLRHQ